jgi:hypothetical protein
MFYHRRDALLKQFLWLKNVPHERVVRWCRPTNFARGLQLCQPVYRQQAIQVLFGQARINVLMIHTDIFRVRRLGNDTIRRIAPPGILALSFSIKGTICPESDPPGRDQGHGAVR